ncbi:polyhydroxyalkanoate synthesis repressor PhaR [Altererythrobacter atlanticus]|uniref:PHB/PHA accumulation regulator DNA-binding domain protein n=1 Tax=Croceibacterium atlanticum TaxID=1267766 RepID=A0A0F7KM19_9SPHN|nr:polyhydroxyalkanoate synthesis repressor PhaR [Croceibacterium atlanticum]AKH41588.1 PHB/PHA accumulation regulator DNA-binding domain protein [Croceibacterium atlanticum]MBB5733050.1 polyhydroxyalkanoate synthesis repressor PhaR [Croceibacterium atlanticum]
MASEKEQGQDPVIIKKYANRRLYNTKSSSYITLDDLSRMTREGIDFQVLDAKTGNDITHAVLTQIIMEEEASGEQMLPISFLRQLISMYGNSMQALMPHYLEASMDNFRANQLKLQETWKASMGPDAFAKLAETNMKMFEAATSAFMPGKQGAAAAPESRSSGNDDLEALRNQMAEMQKKLDEMGK